MRDAQGMVQHFIRWASDPSRWQDPWRLPHFSGYDVSNHLSEEHLFRDAHPGSATSELMAIHREIHAALEADK